MGCLMPQSAGPAGLFADSASPERELRFHSGCRMRKRPRRTGSRTFLHLLECRGKVESSAFRIVSDLVILSLLAAFPQRALSCIAPTRQGCPSARNPGAALTGPRSRCGETHSGMREWQPALGAHAESGTFYFAGTGTFYFAPTPPLVGRLTAPAN